MEIKIWCLISHPALAITIAVLIVTLRVISQTSSEVEKDDTGSFMPTET